jgi:hypothetical protein
MKIGMFAGALALASVCVSGAAWADDPNDPVLSRSAAARARDAAMIRKLNLDQAAYVRARDARYAAEAAESRRRMEEWRRAVRLCQSGHYEYCAH